MPNRTSIHDRVVAVILIVEAFVAGYAPVARAARVDPAVVPRAE
jgi:ABC-type lipoprotein release transport system permease subunit